MKILPDNFGFFAKLVKNRFKAKFKLHKHPFLIADCNLKRVTFKSLYK